MNLTRLKYSLILDTDAYKCSQFLQYPPGTTTIYSYTEPRGGYADKIMFFGLQYNLIEFISQQITQEDIEEARHLLLSEGKTFFNEAGWQYIVDVHDGYLPLEIRAVAEGTIVPVSNCLMTIFNTDPNCYWLTSYIEPILMRGNWYGTTVATISWRIKRIIREFFEKTASEESMASIDYRLCDFGTRGVSSYESAMVGGAAHLSQFDSTDNIPAIRFAKAYYGSTKPIQLVPASEHSTITSWGRENEVKAYANMVKQFGRAGMPFACVSDSYDLKAAVEHLWGEELREMVIESGATLVVRPDSGKPSEMVLMCLELLAKKFGEYENDKGFRVLNDNVRVIQGDGVDEDSIREILDVMLDNCFSAENVFFGMGGALLQKVNRDTHEFAIKCSAAEIDGEWIDVYKDPITSNGTKTSKKGRLSLFKNLVTGELKTLRLEEVDPDVWEDQLVTVFLNGKVMKEYTLEEIRRNTDRG